ncbi:MAG: DegT/DnrJ/EryC1/StrS family aminotransferase [Gaiellaceae bacterium]
MDAPSDLARPAIAGGEPLFDELLVFGKPALGEEEVAAVSEVVRSAWIGQGPRCAEFEQRFAELTGAAHAISVSSCTAGLHLALAVLGIGPGDEVVTTSLTFVATLNAILHTGATVVLADVDPVTLNLDPEQAAAKIGPRTKAILPVHFGGHPADLDAFRALAGEHRLALVEDAAHAVGARYGGEPIGARGIPVFSFYANKNITTAEGGMITCEDAELADRLGVLRLHGLSRDAWKRFGSKKVVYSDAVDLGFKYNLTDLQAALGLVQLRRLDEFMDVRRRICAVYDEELAGVPGLRTPPRPWTDDLRHAHHLYIVEVDPGEFGCDREDLLEGLRAENIGAGIHYRAAHTHPYYRRTLGLPVGALPEAERLSERVLSLPLSATMAEEDAARVALAVRRLHAYHAGA